MAGAEDELSIHDGQDRREFRTRERNDVWDAAYQRKVWTDIAYTVGSVQLYTDRSIWAFKEELAHIKLFLAISLKVH